MCLLHLPLAVPPPDWGRFPGSLPHVCAFSLPFSGSATNYVVLLFFVITANIRPRVVFLEESEDTLVSHAGPLRGVYFGIGGAYAARITRHTRD